MTHGFNKLIHGHTLLKNNHHFTSAEPYQSWLLNWIRPCLINCFSDSTKTCFLRLCFHYRRLLLNVCVVMNYSDVIAARFLTFDQMYSYEKRLQTFADWPFREDCQCTPEQVSYITPLTGLLVNKTFRPLV